MTRAVKTSLQLLLLLYPFYVWWAVSHWHPVTAVIPAVLLVLVKAGSRNTDRRSRVFFLLSCLVLVLAIALGKAETAMLYYPVWMNAGMLLLFSWSLYFPPTVVERIAALLDGPLDAKGIAYTRKVTKVWCLFFFGNGLIAAVSAWWGNWDLWLLYNGAIAYVLMGLLMLIEWLVRRRVKAA